MLINLIFDSDWLDANGPWLDRFFSFLLDCMSSVCNVKIKSIRPDMTTLFHARLNRRFRKMNDNLGIKA